jgi:exodeoxyribonuclease V alpha subunit
MSARTMTRPVATTTPQDRTQRELCGVVSRVQYHDGTSGFFVGQLSTGETVLGEVQQDEIEIGTRYRFLGRWIDHATRGPQFKFDSLIIDTPSDRRGVVQYLCREAPKLVTQRQAEKLVDRYTPAAVLDVLRTDTGRVVADGLLGAWPAGELAALLRERQAFERTTVDLFTLFAGRGFPRNTIKACIARWGVRAADVCRRSPYSMLVAEIPGVGFTRADKLYVELGHDPARLKRQMLAAWDALRSDSDGHTWHVEGKCRTAIIKAVGVQAARFDAAIQMGIRSRWLATRTASDGRQYITERGKQQDEQTIADELRRLMRCRASLWPVDFGPPLSDHQQQALATILTGPVAILGGTPGTGKTFSAAQVLGQLMRRVGRERIAVCAPTGKAAVRITEALARYSIALEATTIHRLLEIGRNGHDGRGWGFQRSRDNPLDKSVVVVDETSMVDVPLMAALLQACGDGTHVLFLGDPYQLPPVGHGAPLRDMIAAGVPSAVLTEIKRNAGLIVTACAAIKDGAKFRTCQKFDAATGDNLRWIECDTPEAQLDALRSVIQGVKQGGRFDPVWECQVLCALNDASPVSRNPLNEMLQGMLNPPLDTVPTGGPFRVRDKIICLRNSMMPLWERLTDDHSPTDTASYHKLLPAADCFVANGDVGRVLAVDASAAVVQFLWPDRTVKIELRKGSKDDPSNEGKAGGGMSDFALAYALTVHKSQGSEYPLVLMMVDDQAGQVASREHLYTAISRASKLCICIGRRATADRQARKVALAKRVTFLRELIQGEPAGSVAPTPAATPPPVIQPPTFAPMTLAQLLEDL